MVIEDGEGQRRLPDAMVKTVIRRLS